jgi:hypothetical protein
VGDAQAPEQWRECFEVQIEVLNVGAGADAQLLQRWQCRNKLALHGTMLI